MYETTVTLQGYVGTPVTTRVAEAGPRSIR